MPLGKGHGAGIKPAVYDLANTLHGTTALAAADIDRVDIWLMQLNIVRAIVRELLKLLDTADRMAMSTAAFPDRQRRSPIAFTRNTPVDNIVEEVAESAGTNSFRYPVNGGVILHQILS